MKFDKYTLTDWHKLSNLTNSSDEYQRLILLDNEPYGNILIYGWDSDEFRICFGYSSNFRGYTLLKEYSYFYNYTSKGGAIFKAKSLQEGKDRVDLFLIKYDKLKAFS